ncbi:major capsid protein [Chryseobacterium manosquense]|uniref:Major capsid protein n=1 Tax=Chryseobacterium manosquense TaxID=2754694 RepID=A0A7H1DT84_9FLAO|nr:major capsid protein [Chryseobacterium manosquense]QNS40192.1 major capsid protein [Chryseobacterium manosquense]
MADILLNKIIPEYNNVDLLGYLDTNPLTDLGYKNYFPLLYKTGLTFGSLEGNTAAKVIAPLVALDSNVILKGRDNSEAIKGQMPKSEVGRVKTETDFFRIRDLRNALAVNNSNTNISNQILDNIYDDALFVRNSINASMEFMSKSLLSQGFYEMNGIKIDFGVTVQNASADWFLPANAAIFDPIKEFMAVQKVALAQGFRYLRAVMDLATFNQFVASEKVVKFTASFAQNALGLAQTPTIGQVNSALLAQNLPTIEIWESYVNEEGKDGALTAKSGWILGNIHLSGTADFGNTQYTISPEATIDLNESTKETVDEFILLSAIGSAAPMRMLTKAAAFATPVLNSVKKRLILKTKLA